jgi:hypothetical protein
MPKQFKLEQSTQMGQKVVGVTITGDKRNNEPETFRIHFPFGDVEVTRANDGKSVADTDYWVHVHVNNPSSSNYCPDGDSGAYDLPGTIKGARLDQTDKHASESNLGDFNRKELYHFTVRIGSVAA